MPIAILLLFAVIGMIGCASAPPPSAPVSTTRSTPGIPPSQEDVEEALKLAQDNKLELQTLSARIREMDGRIQMLSEQLEAAPLDKLHDYDVQLDSLRRRLSSAEVRISQAGSSTVTPVEPLPDPARTAGTLPAATVVRAKISPAEAALYKKASNLYFAHKYADAIAVYRELESQYPKGGYSDNGLYWIGECQFALKNYEQAIASFRKVLEFKETEKADDAQLKLGYSYLRMNNRKQAVAEFRKVVSLYPDSEYLEKAKAELAKLESSNP